MERLTPESYARVKAAALELDYALRKQKILKSLTWKTAHKTAFLSRGKLPRPAYTPVDMTEVFEHIARVRQTMTGEHVVFEWLQRMADNTEATALMLMARGTAAFSTHSQTLYGAPSQLLIDRTTRAIDLARHLDDQLSDLDKNKLVIDLDEAPLNAESFKAALAPELEKHMGRSAPKIVIVPVLGSKASAGSTRISLREDAMFSEQDIQQLLHHEALVHTATGLNGKAQKDFPFLGRAHAGATQIQEGLAVFAEIVTGAIDPTRFRRLADRVIAIEMSLQGADFKEVFDFYHARSRSRGEAYENTRRIFRGGLITGGAPFTKDMVYLGGLLRVHNYMRTVVSLGRADLIRMLFVGKFDLEDIPALALLVSDGRLRRPRFMPPWVKDLRFLVAYMAYSGFLNQVQLPGFQRYYEDRLANVPVIWDDRTKTG